MFIKRDLVMLPTNEKADLYRPFVSDKLYHNISKIDKASSYTDVDYQHLCILSDEEIKEGNYFYHKTLGILKCNSTETTPLTKSVYLYYYAKDNIEYRIDSRECKKIIATTDKLILKISKSINKEQFPDILVPQPSQSFIEHFVSEYNKGNIITEVVVEYETSKLEENHVNPIYQRLKVNPDNTINIKSVSKYEDLYKAIDKIKEGHTGSAINFIERFINTQNN